MCIYTTKKANKNVKLRRELGGGIPKINAFLKRSKKLMVCVWVRVGISNDGIFIRIYILQKKGVGVELNPTRD